MHWRYQSLELSNIFACSAIQGQFWSRDVPRQRCKWSPCSYRHDRYDRHRGGRWVSKEAWRWVQGHKELMSLWPKSCGTTCSFYVWNSDLIRSQFCTCHDNRAVVACAKLWPDWVIWIKFITKFSQDFNDELTDHLWNGSQSLLLLVTCRKDKCNYGLTLLRENISINI